MKQQSILESRFLRSLLFAVGGFMFVIALVQLPFSIFYHNTRPGLPWLTKGATAEGIIVSPRENDPDVTPSPFREDDIITQINGIKVDSTMLFDVRFRSMLNNLRIGDTLRVALIRDGMVRHVEYLLYRSRSDFYGPTVTFSIYLFNGIAPLVTLLLALVVLIRRPGARRSVLYTLMSLTLAFYLMVLNDVNSALPWWPNIQLTVLYIADASFAIFYAELLHFLFVFPETHTHVKPKAPRNLMIYAPFILLFLGSVLFDTYTGLTPQWYKYIFYGMYILSPFLGALILKRALRRAQTTLIRKAMKVILIGVLVFGLTIAAIITINELGMSQRIAVKTMQTWRVILLPILTLIVPVTFGTAILRYGFIDIGILFKRTTVYTVLTASIILFFISLNTILELSVSAFSRFEILFVASIITGAFAVLLGVMKERIQTAIHRQLFREESRIADELHALSRTMLNYLDHDSVLCAMSTNVREILKLNSASVVAVESNGETILLAGDPLPKEEWQTLLGMTAFRESLEKEQILSLPMLSHTVYHKSLSVTFCIAASNGERITVVLGEKISGHPFSHEEIESIRSLADHATLGWKNAVLTTEMRKQELIKKEIEIAHSIQAAMLPRETPDLPGLQVAAVSIAAHDIGGDFFDFIQHDRMELGIVVGDVSDKGVSAAMVMASSISTIRFASDAEKSPRDILACANKRLCKDTNRNMFVAAFYGFLDMASRTLTFTNAGLPKPLLYRGGESFLLDWSENGQHFPLGAKEKTVFHEQSLPMFDTDILVLYTDGVIETTNESDEEFDVKRLRDVVSMHAQESAEAIKEAVFDAIRGFRAQKELFDDLTLVVIKLDDTSHFQTESE